MGITLNWDSQVDQDLTAIEIYRSESPIDENVPGVPIATLAPDAVTYEDTNVRVGNTYYYRVAVVKDTARSLAAEQAIGYFANLGPGPTRILRGDWVRGFFGEISNNDWVSPSDVVDKIKAVLKSTTGLTYSTGGTWHKFVYKNKIFFAIPNANMITANNWTNAYNAGFIFGEDGFGELPTGPAGEVNQRVIIEILGDQYLVRPIRLTDKPTSEYLTSQEDFLDSEWKGTVARCRSDANALTDPTIQARVNDLSSISNTTGAHLYDESNVASALNASAETLTNSKTTSSMPFVIVLELLQ